MRIHGVAIPRPRRASTMAAASTNPASTNGAARVEGARIGRGRYQGVRSRTRLYRRFTTRSFRHHSRP